MRTARVLAASVAALLLSWSLAPAHADEPPVDPPAPVCQFSKAKVSRSAVVLRAAIDEGVKPQTVKVQISATASGCETSDSGLLVFGDSYVGDFTPSPQDPTQWSGTAVFRYDSVYNSDAGKRPLQVDLFGDVGLLPIGGVSLSLKREAELDFDAPAKVKKNKTFGLTLIMFIADWDDNWAYPGMHKQVTLQFRTSGGKWKTIKKAYTRTAERQAGDVRLNWKVKKYTCFRWTYAGTSTISSAVSETRCVHIKK